MSLNKLLLLSVFYLVVTTIRCQSFRYSEYYWRDYYGHIPKDAIPGGVDKYNRMTYIGQVFIERHGLFPVGIYPGKTSVDAVIGWSTYSSDVYVKILCTKYQESFEWIPVTSKNLHLVTIGKQLVVGGSESGKALNIGRIFYQSQIIVGKLPAYNLGFANLFFSYGNEKYAETYEVLVHNLNRTRLIVI